MAFIFAPWRIAALACLVAFGAAPGNASAGEPLDRLVADTCDKQVVLLGEDSNHGSGGTTEVKTAIVRRLVDECGFSLVLFESQVYDFLELERSFEAGQTTPAGVAEAIGGLWSGSRDGDVLASYLFSRADTGKVMLGGLDPQVGGAMQRFTQAQLPAHLASALAGDRRIECESGLSTLTNWRFDAATRYDDDFRQGLASCLADIREAIADKAAGLSADELMAMNLSRYLDMASGNAFAIRDRAMFENFQWYRERSAGKPKIIIWCATVHAARQPWSGDSGRLPLGYHVRQALGDRAIAIGFSALSGSHGGRGRPPIELAPVAPDSLEARAFSGHAGDLRYLDAVELAALGPLPARAVDYSRSTRVDWAQILDGVLVLRRERPPLE